MMEQGNNRAARGQAATGSNVARGLALGQGLPAWEAFEEAARRGEVTITWLPERGQADLAICNYTPRTIYERRWTAVTRIARGLIVRPASGEVVALPMEKFMNLAEDCGDGTVARPAPGPFEALVKLDGALGILFRHEGRVRWATRGSFEQSLQSQAAQRLWDAKYRQHEPLLFGEWQRLTLMVEIIHPTSRVVVRYPFEDLVLIAARDRYTGEDLAHQRLIEIGHRLGMPVVERVAETSLAALQDRVRQLDDNHEGFVLRWPDGYRLKLKGAAYLELHRLLSDFTPNRQAQAWLEARLEKTLLALPEEFRAEAEQVARELDARVEASRQELERLYAAAREAAGQDRGRFARWVKENAPGNLHGALFARWQLDLPEAPARLAGDLIVDVWRTGRLGEVLSVDNGPLAEAVARIETGVAEVLWTWTRTAEGRAAAHRWVAQLPRDARGVATAALDELNPDRAIAQARDFVARPDQRGLLSGQDVERLFANLPPADCPIYEHLAYVLTQPLALRVYLDKYRRAWQRETAVAAARRLLATAWHSGQLDAAVARLPTLDDDAEDTLARVSSGLDSLRARIARVWEDVAADGGAAAETGARTVPDGRDERWAEELRRVALTPLRRQVYERFAAEHAGDRGRSALLEDA